MNINDYRLMPTLLPHFKILITLISLFVGACNDLNALFYHDGIYKLDRYEVQIACSDFPPERAGFGLETHLMFDTPYFRLKYEGFSVSTYVLSPCETDKAEQCESLYFFDPDDVNLEGNRLIIDENKACGEQKRFIQAELIRRL